MSSLLLSQLIHHKYGLIFTVHMGSSLLRKLSSIYRQFGLWARYIGELMSGQDHLNFYKWLSFEFAPPIPDLSLQNRDQIPYLGNFLDFRGQWAG